MACRWWASVGLALLGAALPSPAPARADGGGDRLVVSLGDAVAAGPAGGSGSDACGRSARSAHARAALTVDRVDPSLVVTFAGLGCAGATLERVGAQVARLDRIPRRPDAVLVSVGAADLRLADAARDCARGRCPAPRPAALRAGLDALAADLARAGVLPGRVVLTELYDPGCGGLVSRRVVALANSELLDAARRHRWRFVAGVADAFAAACARWIDGGRPNDRGHGGTAALVAPALAAALVRPAPARAAAPAPPPEDDDGLRDLALTAGGALAGLMLGVALAFALLRRRA